MHIIAKLIPFIIVLFLCISCTLSDGIDYDKEYIFNNNNLPCVSLDYSQLQIKEGFISQKADTIRVINEGEVVAAIVLSKPVMVAQAANEESWGYFQSPIIYDNEDNNIIVQWQMKDDSYTTYGIQGSGFMMSRDDGETWEPLDKEYPKKRRYRVELRNGDFIQVKSVKSSNITDFNCFPSPVGDTYPDNCVFYYNSELPYELQGVYLERYNRHTKEPTTIHSIIDDPTLLRQSFDNLLPIIWYGDIKELNNGSLVAGMYPAYYKDSQGTVLRTTTSFYISSDFGYNWKLLGTISQQKDNQGNYCPYDGGDGFCEPSFEILEDGTYLCVFRSGNVAPLFRSYSYDAGSNWTEPEAFTPNGVLPTLLKLDNGALVLVSGRPGIQLRINPFGDGRAWTVPIEMFPFIDKNGNYSHIRETCGYASVMKTSDHTFYLVYSYFRTLNEFGEFRKAIFFRKIDVLL